jgi:hypothetical protein
MGRLYRQGARHFSGIVSTHAICKQKDAILLIDQESIFIIVSDMTQLCLPGYFHAAQPLTTLWIFLQAVTIFIVEPAIKTTLVLFSIIVAHRRLHILTPPETAPFAAITDQEEKPGGLRLLHKTSGNPR